MIAPSKSRTPPATDQGQAELCLASYTYVRSRTRTSETICGASMIVWRRHVAPCESTDRTDPRCGCPIYQEYRVNRKRFRRTLKTTNWQKALADARQKEMGGFKDNPKSPSIEQACDKYLEDAKARELREPTLYKFRLLFRQLQEFAKDKGLVFVSDFNLDNLRQFRASWPNKRIRPREAGQSEIVLSFLP
jgi:hypothetical protein